MKRKTFENLAFLAVFAFLARNFAIRLADPDLWGRFAVGKLFLANGGMPTTDPFAFTPTLPLWVDHEWLTGVAFYGVFSGFGLGGILVLKILLGVAAVAIAAWTSRNSERLPTALLIALAMPAIGYGLMPRAQLFTYVLFALWLALLETYRQCGSKRWLWLVPVTTIPWVNLHGGFLAGLGLLAIYTVCAIGDRRCWTFAVLLAIATPLTLVNWYGLDYWTYLVSAVTMPRPNVQEWAAVPWSLTFWPFWLLAAVTVAAVGRLPWKKESLTPLAVLGVTLALAVLHVRHAPLFALSAIAFVPPVLFPRKEHAPTECFPRLAGLAVAAAALFQLYGLFADGPFTLVASERVATAELGVPYPVRSISIAAQRNLAGNLAVPFNWGEYAIWHLPQCKVSMDGRYETVYPDRTVQMVDDFFAGRSRELLDNFPTEHVLAPNDSPVNELLEHEPGWHELAKDDASTLWSCK